MKKSTTVLLALLVVVAVAAVSVGVTLALTGDEKTPAAKSTASPKATQSQPATQTVSSDFHINDGTWVATIDGTSWNRCDGEPECDGLECYGTGPADGLEFGTEVLVTNSDGEKVGLGEVETTWGWKRGATRGACVLTWSVDVPTSETGVLTVTFDENPDWSHDFTLAKMTKAPHALDLFIGI